MARKILITRLVGLGDVAAILVPAVHLVRQAEPSAQTEAQHLVRRCMAAVEAEKKVMIGFRLGDLWADIFTYSKGKRAGEQGVSLKARLLFITWIKVDGQQVYKADPRPVDQTAADTGNTAAGPLSQDSALESHQPQADDTEAATDREPASDDSDSAAETSAHVTSPTETVDDSF